MTTYYVDGSVGSDIGNPGTSPGAGNAWATIGKAASTVAAGDLVNIKNASDYTITAEITFNTGGNNTSGPIVFRGYTSSPGDGGRFVVKTSTDNIKLFNLGANYLAFDSFELKHQASTKNRGIYSSAADRSFIRLSNFRIEDCTYGVDGENTTYYTIKNLICENGEVVGGTTLGISGYNMALSNMLIRGCGDGIRAAQFTSFNCVSLRRVRVCNSTGNGLLWPGSSTFYSGLLNVGNCAFVSNAGDGIKLDFATADVMFCCDNSIFYGNTGYGINVSAAKYLVHKLRNCAFLNTGGAYTSTYITNSQGEVTLSGDPFTNSASYDFSLDSTAGEGSACRAAGFSGSWGGTGYLDIGAVQHQDAASGGKQRVYGS